MDELDATLHRIGQHHFRARFRLRGRDRAVVDLRGITTVRRHAAELVERRLAPAEPRNDGRQTPSEQGYVVEAICRWIVGKYAPHRPPR